MFHLDWRFLPVVDAIDPATHYAGRYSPGLVVTSIVIAILAAYVALSISGRIVAAQTARSRIGWTSAGAVVMGGGIWAMHFLAMLAFSLPCGVGYNLLGTIASMIPGMLASYVALSVISRQDKPSFSRLCIGAVLMGAGIGTMHYSGMAAMEPQALLRYDPLWAAFSVVTAVALAFVSLSIRFRFRWGEHSNMAATLLSAAVMGFAVSGMHYTAMRASLFFPLSDAPEFAMALAPLPLAVVITVVTVLIASITLVASFAGRQAELALSLRTEIAERERGKRRLIKARRAAEDANRAKSQFLATMSHEIRTPLNGVIGMANLLASTPLNERQAQLVDNLARSGRTLLALINDILDFSRIEAHELELFEAPFEIRDVVADVIDLFGEPCGSKGIELIYAVSNGVPVQLNGDAVRLRQILINLVGNAIKFTEQGQVVVRIAPVASEGDTIMLALSVEDTGIGIEPDKLGQIFEPFRQADASMTRSRGGSGLGLAITKRLVELQGGAIGVESRPGHGSRFHCTARFRRVATSGVGGDTERRIARRLRALLVDSNDVSAGVMRDNFERWGIVSVVVDDPDDARKAFTAAAETANPFDVALIDIKGLGKEGTELARFLRGSETAPQPALILLVGMSDLADDGDIETLNAAAVMTKPARPSVLFDTLASIASGIHGKPLLVRRNARSTMPSFEARVLVVEDNAVNQEVATGILENMDCSVVVAANGKCAVERFMRENFDLILMDCEMPIMDGFEGAAHIRRIEAGRTESADPSRPIPIIALTAHALAEIREKCLRSGMNDFLVKPFDELQIAEMLRRWIPQHERARREKAIARLEPENLPSLGSTPVESVIDMSAISKITAISGNGRSSLFERVVSQFATTAPSLAAALREQCEAGDSEAVWRTAHSLKSSAAALGATRVSRCCAEIEALAKESGAASVLSLLTHLEADLAAARRGLQELVGGEHV